MSNEGLRPRIEGAERKTRKIIIFNAREYDVLNLTAQGIPNSKIAKTLSISESSVKSALSKVTRKLETHTALQATKKGIEIGIVDTKELRRGFTIATLNSLSAREKKMLDLMDKTDEEIDYRLLAKHIGKSFGTLKTNLTELYNKFPKRDITHVAAVYKSLQPFVGSQRPDTLVVIDRHAQDTRQSISESNIELFLKLSQRANQGIIEEKIYLKLINELLAKIATRARFTAMIKGYDKGIVFLPTRTESLEDRDYEILQANPLFKQLTQIARSHRLATLV